MLVVGVAVAAVVAGELCCLCLHQWCYLIVEVVEAVAESKTIIWNGPMGVFEMSKFEIGIPARKEQMSKEATTRHLG